MQTFRDSTQHLKSENMFVSGQIKAWRCEYVGGTLLPGTYVIVLNVRRGDATGSTEMTVKVDHLKVPSQGDR